MSSLPVERASVQAFWEDFFSPEHVPILEQGVCSMEARRLLSKHLGQIGDDRHDFVPTRVDLEARVQQVAKAMPAHLTDAICRGCCGEGRRDHI